MIAILDFSLRLHIAGFAPELIFVFKDLLKIKNKIVCPFHSRSIIYINKPCKICGFVKRLSIKELQKFDNNFYNTTLKRWRKRNRKRKRITNTILSMDPF